MQYWVAEFNGNRKIKKMLPFYKFEQCIKIKDESTCKVQIISHI